MHVSVWHNKKSLNIPVWCLRGTCLVWHHAWIFHASFFHMWLFYMHLFIRCSMMISYTSGYYAYLVSSDVRARHTQLKSDINSQNLVHNCERNTCREQVNYIVAAMF